MLHKADLLFLMFHKSYVTSLAPRELSCARGFESLVEAICLLDFQIFFLQQGQSRKKMHLLTSFYLFIFYFDGFFFLFLTSHTRGNVVNYITFTRTLD